ncbi:DUF732 domain-containing protein [Mycolicibacterium mucogenicum]|uniref:DUF732 domain-containing protein n=1 Tax=Mycolicibacterium mucogenicum TaxID=56689 RepID=UPI003977BB51
MKVNFFAGIVACLAAVALAPTAHADQYDYVNMLDNKGVYYGSISDVIDVGKLTCSRLRAGSPQTAGAPASAAGYSSYEVGIIILAATNNMCPDQLPTLQAYINAPAPQRPSQPVPSSEGGALNVDTPMSHPPCDGTGIVILGSVTTPGEYAEGVQQLLNANPGASYLRTDQSCPSLRQTTADGNAIYAVYRPVGGSQSAVCASVSAAGGKAYGKWLDDSTAPDFIIPC